MDLEEEEEPEDLSWLEGDYDDAVREFRSRLAMMLKQAEEEAEGFTDLLESRMNDMRQPAGGSPPAIEPGDSLDALFAKVSQICAAVVESIDGIARMRPPDGEEFIIDVPNGILLLAQLREQMGCAETLLGAFGAALAETFPADE
jgi:hypothetical protein